MPSSGQQEHCIHMKKFSCFERRVHGCALAHTQLKIYDNMLFKALMINNFSFILFFIELGIKGDNEDCTLIYRFLIY